MDLLHTRVTNLHPVLSVMDLLHTRATNLHPVLSVIDLLHTRATNLHPVLIVMDLLHTRATNLRPVLRTSCVFDSVRTPLKLYVLLLCHLIPSSHQALSKGTLLIIDIKLKLQCKVVENWHERLSVDTKNVKTTRTQTHCKQCASSHLPRSGSSLSGYQMVKITINMMTTVYEYAAFVF